MNQVLPGPDSRYFGKSPKVHSRSEFHNPNYLVFGISGLGTTEFPLRLRQWEQLETMKQGDKWALTGSSITSGSPARISRVATTNRPLSSVKSISRASLSGGKAEFRSRISNGHLRHSSSSMSSFIKPFPPTFPGLE